MPVRVGEPLGTCVDVIDGVVVLVNVRVTVIVRVPVRVGRRVGVRVRVAVHPTTWLAARVGVCEAVRVTVGLVVPVPTDRSCVAVNVAITTLVVGTG